MFFTYQGYPFLSLKSENKNSCLNVFKSWMKNGAIFRVKEAIMDSRCHLGISEGSYFLLLTQRFEDGDRYRHEGKYCENGC